MRGIVFNTKLGLERAVLEGRKTVIRKRIKCPKKIAGVDVYNFCVARDYKGDVTEVFCIDYDEAHIDGGTIRPPYKIGEIVAIKQCYDNILNPELYHELLQHYDTQCIEDLAGYKNKMFVACKFMPHKIKILDIRVERLQDISEEDCVKEGIQTANDVARGNNLREQYDGWFMNPFEWQMYPTAKEAFAALIDKVSKKGTWERNPFVWRIEYELIKEEL